MQVDKHLNAKGEIVYGINISPEGWYNPHGLTPEAEHPSVRIPLTKAEVLNLIYVLNFMLGQPE